MEESLKKVGGRPLYIAAEDCPLDASRVWTRGWPRRYTEESEVCDAVPLEPIM